MTGRHSSGVLVGRPFARALTACLSLASALAFERAAHAAPDDGPTLIVDDYEPGAVPIYDLLSLARTRVPRHLAPAFALQLGYVADLVELAREDDLHAIDASLVSHRVRADATLALGLFERFAVALQVPFVLDQSGDDLAPLDRPGEVLSGAAFEDLRFAVRARLLAAAGFGLALAADLWLPTGDETALASAGGFRFRPTLAMDWHDDSGLGVVFNLGYVLVPEGEVAGLAIDDGLTWGLGVDLPTPLPELHVLAAVFGTAPIAADRDDARTAPVELTAAFQIAPGDLVFELGGGTGLSRGIGAPAWRAFVEVAWTPAAELVPDSDGDGLPDPEDACPRAAEDHDGHADGDGCPDEDDDGDGIPDVDDGSPDATGFGSCRDAPEDLDGFFDSDGCPEPDNDGDGFPDRLDGPPDASGFGACRDQVEDRDGHDDEDGCPDPDNDGDGVPDTDDGPPDAGRPGFGACRDAPETKNGYRDDDGCPDEAPKAVRVTRERIEILEKIFFSFDRERIKPESFGLLDEVARVMREAPEIALVEVQGHTDGSGNALYNMGLSQRRAEAVVAYLVDRGGVAPGRLVAKGYGATRPLVTGPAATSGAGRALNRRVEFVIRQPVP